MDKQRLFDMSNRYRAPYPLWDLPFPFHMLMEPTRAERILMHIFFSAMSVGGYFLIDWWPLVGWWALAAGIVYNLAFGVSWFFSYRDEPLSPEAFHAERIRRLRAMTQASEKPEI